MDIVDKGTCMTTASRSASTESDRLASVLATPDAYPDPTTHVECRETHISRVFLTDQFAYKQKKPVRFEFLDFSTCDLRRQACLAELQLNRRLAPDVYLEVLPITQSADGSFHLGDRGNIVDSLVKMRRLNDADTLLAAIQQQRVDSAQIDSLANLLADFYRRQAPLAMTADEYRRRIEQRIRNNLAELLSDEHQFPSHEIRRIHSAQLVFLALNPQIFDARVAAGRIVDGHGDLRPEHVYLTSPPAIIDCIEFNAEFRQIDVLDELAFLESECALMQAEEVGYAIRERCAQLLNDHPPKELAAFHKSFRACVRAKVACLRARQLPQAMAGEQIRIARKYLDLADQFDEVLGPPLLLVVGGASGTGKSTIAHALAERLGIEVLQTDKIRQGLVDAGHLPSDNRDAKYESQNRERVYDAMLAAADQLLQQHSSVILDGTFLNHKHRRQVAALADRHHARWLIIRCECPLEVAQNRIASRLQSGNSLSEAIPDLVEKQLAADEQDDPSWPVITCDTSHPAVIAVREIIERLRAL